MCVVVAYLYMHNCRRRPLPVILQFDGCYKLLLFVVENNTSRWASLAGGDYLLDRRRSTIKGDATWISS